MKTYEENIRERIAALKGKEDVLVLGIESSCDETAASVVKNGREVLSSVIASQIDIHRRYGGVVPEIASRNHTAAVDGTVAEALSKAGKTLDDIDLIAVTYGAGLLGALLVGVSYAKALSYAKNIPLIAVSHIKGHIAANYIACRELEPPYICLLASGGHTAILKITGYTTHELLGSTQDDAAGEAFDKVARVLGLPYPGGPEIEKLAKNGKPTIALPRAFKGEQTLNFSYSGLKTAVINYVQNAKARGDEVVAADVACSFQRAAVSVLVDNALSAAKTSGIKRIVIAGGVGANGCLRDMLKTEGEKQGVTVSYPPLWLCTDNAAMIASAGYYNFLSGEQPADLSLDAKANIPLG